MKQNKPDKCSLSAQFKFKMIKRYCDEKTIWFLWRDRLYREKMPRNGCGAFLFLADIFHKRSLSG